MKALGIPSTLKGLRPFPAFGIRARPYICDFGLTDWLAQDLVCRAKNDPSKLAIAVRLRGETTLTITAKAALVDLGTYNTANACLHRAMKVG
jgi:hypothetical protein